MSNIAVRQRSQRQNWAAPGSSHDRLVGVLGVVLPSSIGVLAAFLVLAPLTAGGDVSFVLDKNKVEVAKERMKIKAATYRGQDQKGQMFELQAASAIQKSSAEPVVDLNRLAAAVELPDGPATIRADTGRYDMDSQQVKVVGPVVARAPNNYRLDTSDATIDLKNRTMQSAGPAKGTVPQGTFSANNMSANLEDRTVTLNGNARLRIVPGRTK
ncbi:MAG: LPS export ABC transporter periplasmic protein LptC [Sphingomonas bacterium]|nr:LPS export ABC transporter periplasmic protein LptC [Sphingomonas bacterium]